MERFNINIINFDKNIQKFNFQNVQPIGIFNCMHQYIGIAITLSKVTFLIHLCGMGYTMKVTQSKTFLQ